VARVAAALDTARGRTAELVTTLEDDPLSPAIARLGGVRGGNGVRIQRGAVGAADSAWARGGNRVLLAWPARFDAPARPAAVTAFGESDATVVAPFVRMGLAADPSDANARILARWNDGAPAVVQSSLGGGCVRHVGIGVPLAGDITLRAPFGALLDALTVPCAGRRGRPLADSTLAWLTGAPSSRLAPARLVAADDSSRTSRLPAVLLGISLALLAAEQLLRRRSVAA
jgi:hypothetical protein